MRRTTTLLLVGLLALTACDRGSEPELTVTTAAVTSSVGEPDAAVTTAPETTVTTAAENGTTTTRPRIVVEDYQVQVQGTEDQGRVLWVTIPPADYTDRDLEDFLVGVVDDEQDLWEFHVLDDPAAVAAARIPEADRTPEEQALVDEHYLVSVTEGNVITFRGPFAAAGTFLIGS